MEKPNDGDIGEQETLKLITEYTRRVAANEITAATAAKALLAAATIIGLQGATSGDIATWLRMTADQVLKGGPGQPH
ncbi:MAG: hypothetical protein U1A72_17045 [Sulfuritalea sp.]|nr:hypothetical protein [Sulfuritalea sp.]